MDPTMIQPTTHDNTRHLDEVLANFVEKIDHPENNVEPLPEINQAVKYVCVPFTEEEFQYLAGFKNHRRDTILDMPGFKNKLDTWMASIQNQGGHGSIFQLQQNFERENFIATWINFIVKLQFFQE